MRRICLLSGLLLLMLQPAMAGHAPPLILFRVFVQTTGQGLPTTQATTISIPPNGETILIRTLPEVTERELVDVQQDASGAVHFRFDHQGQVNLSAVTAQNQGRILVVMINGFIMYAPVIDQQITDGELVMPHQLNPKALGMLQQMAQYNVQQHNRR